MKVNIEGYTFTKASQLTHVFHMGLASILFKIKKRCVELGNKDGFSLDDEEMQKLMNELWEKRKPIDPKACEFRLKEAYLKTLKGTENEGSV